MSQRAQCRLHHSARNIAVPGSQDSFFAPPPPPPAIVSSTRHLYFLSSGYKLVAVDLE